MTARVVPFGQPMREEPLYSVYNPAPSNVFDLADSMIREAESRMPAKSINNGDAK